MQRGRRACLLFAAGVVALLGLQAWDSPSLHLAAAALLSLCAGP